MFNSIPNNNDNQDIVSMGCNAALMTKRVIDNSFEVMAIHLVTILQAIDYLQCHDRLSSVSMSLYDKVREIFPKFIEDQPRYKEIARVRDFLENADHIFAFENNETASANVAV